MVETFEVRFQISTPETKQTPLSLALTLELLCCTVSRGTPGCEVRAGASELFLPPLP